MQTHNNAERSGKLILIIYVTKGAISPFFMHFSVMSMQNVNISLIIAGKVSII